MLKLELTEDQKQVLQYERYHHPHPRVRQKMEVLWLKSQGLPHQEIARLAGVSENTMRSYLQEYAQGGLIRLREVRFHRPQSALDEHQASLKAYFRQHPPATVNEARAKIAELTGITRSPTQVREWMKRWGMRCRKIGVLPAKGDPDTQAEYQKKVGAAPSRGAGGNARGLLRGRRSLCFRGLCGRAMVFCPGLDQGTQRTAPLQCLRRPQRLDP